MLILFYLCVCLTACSAQAHPSVLVIPIPPNAQAVQSTSNGPVHRVSFVTTDAPDVVLQWYRVQLEQQQWRPNIDLPKAHVINYLAHGPPVLTIMEVNAQPTDDHTTRVIVVMKPEPPA